ncbi:glycogen synthase GlgA [Desulfovibrio sp. OttesenSCG-928-C14]|nr:glycogen synthase GlgA [Desulfovibrio sp. OttesenSCG-928-C14]
MTRSVIFVASEMFPFSKTGGLGDVIGSLPLALHRLGVPVSVILPMYRQRVSRHKIHRSFIDLPVGYPWGPITADAHLVIYQGMPVYFIERAEYFDRSAYYNTSKGDYFDNAERFIFFNRAVLSLIRNMGEPAPDIIHVHDWQSAMLPAFVHYYRQTDPFWSATSTVQTVHNLAFQGRFSSRLFENCGLPPEAWDLNGVEYFGDLNMLKAGLCYADRITTVSPNYASEILTPEFGYGMDGVLRARRHQLHGILNGVNYSVWNPEHNHFLPKPYSAEDLSGKQVCKKALLDELGMDPALASRPLFGFIGRLREQKGIDLLYQIVPDLMRRNMGVVVLGEGAPRFEEICLEFTRDYPARFGGVIKYTEALAHRVQAGCDAFLMPSRYEPCGLTQMYAMRFGTPPLAPDVGGLHDTIIPWPNNDATGFIFKNNTPDELLDTILEAMVIWENNPELWREMMLRGMRKDFSWTKSAESYINLYRELAFDPSRQNGIRSLEF